MTLGTHFAVAGLLFGVTAVSGSPIQERDTNPGTTFSVQQVSNPAFTGYVTSGQAALEKTYAKFNVKLPKDLAGAIQAAKSAFNPTGSVVAEPQIYDSAYLCPVQIGSPPKSLFLDFDTGSSDLWVFSTETAAASVNRQKLYDPASSKTSRKLAGYTWSISYGDGSGSYGDVYTDNVSIGGVKVNTQAVEAATNVSSSFTENSASSGLLGLGFDTLNTVKPNKQATWFDNVQGVLKQPVFTVDLKANALGSYNFGYIDTKRNTSAITYTPLTSSRGYWEIVGTGYGVGNSSSKSFKFNKFNMDGIVDTGTTLLLLDDDILQDYYAKVKSSTFSTKEGGWIFPCTATLPDFVFGIGASYRGVIPGAYLNYATTSTKADYCFGGLQANTDIGFSIFGDILLKAQFVVFDSVNKQVGFASKAL